MRVCAELSAVANSTNFCNVNGNGNANNNNASNVNGVRPRFPTTPEKLKCRGDRLERSAHPALAGTQDKRTLPSGCERRTGRGFKKA